MYCRNCGKEIDEHAVVCVHCGVAIASPAPAVGPNAKSKLVAGLLAIFLGAFGVHNFYLGYIRNAVIQLVITIFVCCVGGLVSSIWALIEAVMILSGKIDVDGKGEPLKS